MESNINLNATDAASTTTDFDEDSMWEEEVTLEKSSELEDFVLRIHGISELKDLPNEICRTRSSSTPIPSSSSRGKINDTGFFDSSFAAFFYSQTAGNQTYSSPGSPTNSTVSSIETPSSMAHPLSSESPLSTLDSTSDESRKKDEILSGVNWNQSPIGGSKKLRLRLRQVQEGLIRTKQYNIVKERLDLLLSVMSARKALGNPLAPQEIPTDLYNIIFHPENI